MTGLVKDEIDGWELSAAERKEVTQLAEGESLPAILVKAKFFLDRSAKLREISREKLYKRVSSIAKTYTSPKAISKILFNLKFSEERFSQLTGKEKKRPKYWNV